MPARSCFVSYVDSEGLRHSVEVQAETLYEAAALAIAAFRRHDCVPGLASNLDIEIRTSVIHTLPFRKVQDWLNGGAKSPKEAILKKRLREKIQQ